MGEVTATVNLGGKDFVTVPALARAKNVSQHTIRAAIARKELEGVKDEAFSRWLIPLASALAWEPAKYGERPGVKKSRRYPAG